MCLGSAPMANNIIISDPWNQFVGYPSRSIYPSLVNQHMYVGCTVFVLINIGPGEDRRVLPLATLEIQLVQQAPFAGDVARHMCGQVVSQPPAGGVRGRTGGSRA